MLTLYVTTKRMFEKEQSLMIEFYVLSKLGKKFCIDSTCFSVVDGSYDCCELNFHGNK